MTVQQKHNVIDIINIANKKKINLMTDMIRQDWKSLLEKANNISLVYLLTEENLYLKSYLSGLKIRINKFIWAAYAWGPYMGGYTWSKTIVKEKVGLSPVGGGLIGGEIQ